MRSFFLSNAVQRPLASSSFNFVGLVVVVAPLSFTLKRPLAATFAVCFCLLGQMQRALASQTGSMRRSGG